MCKDSLQFTENLKNEETSQIDGEISEIFILCHFQLPDLRSNLAINLLLPYGSMNGICILYLFVL